MPASAIQTPCQTTAPIRRSSPLPKYWDTNVPAYMHTPSGQQISAHHSSAAGKTGRQRVLRPAIRNIRSTNVSSVHDRLDSTSGKASCSTSRPPHGRLHQHARAVVERIGLDSQCSTRPVHSSWRMIQATPRRTVRDGPSVRRLTQEPDAGHRQDTAIRRPGSP